jgi:hypothetical protein
MSKPEPTGILRVKPSAYAFHAELRPGIRFVDAESMQLIPKIEDLVEVLIQPCAKNWHLYGVTCAHFVFLSPIPHGAGHGHRK